MSKFLGGFITKSPVTPTTTAASGIWSLQQAMAYKKAGAWPASIAGDSYFSNVVLLLHMDGNNGGTTFTDSSSYAHTITANGACQTITGTKKFGTASGRFAANPDYLSLPNTNMNFGTGDFTVEFWLYYDSTQQAASYGCFFDNGSQGVFLSFGSSKTNIIFYSPNGGITDTTGYAHGMTNGNWYHLAFVRNGNSCKCYVNGSSIGTWTSNGGSMSPAGGTLAYVGEYTGGLSYSPGGYIDDFRITKGVARYTSNFAVPTGAFPDSGASGGSSTDPYFANVIALFHCDGTNGSTTFTDNSSSPKTVTAGNTSISTSTYKFGTGSANFGSSNNGYLSFNTELTITGDYTLEFWAYLTGISGSGYSIGFGATSVNSQVPQFHSDGHFGYYNNGSSFNTGTGKFSLNTWFHCAVVRSSNTVKIYVNGVDTGTSGSDSNTLYIKNISGYNGGASGYNVLGYFDDIRISNIARYTANFTPPSAAFPNSA